MFKLAALAVFIGVVGILAAPQIESASAEQGDGSTYDRGMYPRLTSYIDARLREFDQIPEQRKAQLEQLAAAIAERGSQDTPAKLVFVCTHNSRRSHMSRLWAAAGAHRFGVRAWTYSGGTQTTAFNPRAVAAITRAGFNVAKTTEDDNPIYHVRLSDDTHPMTCFSKTFDGAPNPETGVIAVMVCDHADETCPAVPGAQARFAITYVDPKVSDNTTEESATYDERCAQIAREMLYAMRKAGS